MQLDYSWSEVFFVCTVYFVTVPFIKDRILWKTNLCLVVSSSHLEDKKKKKEEFPEDIMILLKMRKLEITLRLHHITGRRLCPLLGNELPA